MARLHLDYKPGVGLEGSGSSGIRTAEALEIARVRTLLANYSSRYGKLSCAKLIA